ncbi:hypothetical protein [Acidithiobacillus acidisediminis]|uniref:hypothetical protein n=1 Tax=Acidithiobacillus acidisediminis TaxID=2937799 RepID=UPI00200CF24A|nr:hypothetical protein [Acidithiobacillus sp. S30A2]
MKYWLLWAAFAVLSVAVLVSSLGTAFQTLPLDSDTAEMAIIANGITNHGLDWLIHWQFPPDNQILSLLPVATLYYWIFGTSLTAIILQGWLIFFANAVITSVIVKDVTKSLFSGFMAFFLALVANPQTVGSPTILAFPISHNIAWFWALLGAYGLIGYISGRSNGLLLVALTVIIGTISDPWFTAAFTIPAMIISWKARRWFHTELHRKSVVIKIIAICFVFGEIVSMALHYFGIFLPNGDPIASLGLLIKHIPILAKSLLLMFSFTPIPNDGPFMVLWVLYAVTAAMTAFILFRLKVAEDNFTRITIRFFMLSISTILVAFIVTGFAQNIGASRFLVNVYYSVIVIISISVHRCWANIRHENKIQNAFCIAPGIALMCYIMLTVHLIVGTGMRFNVSKNERTLNILVHFLEEKHLNYGFGPYFQNVNTMLLNVVSSENVTGVPVSCNMGYMTPFFGGGGNKLWLSPDKSVIHNQFVVFRRGDVRYNQCIKNNAGIPNKVYHIDNWTIFGYHKNLTPMTLENVKIKHEAWVRYNIKRNRIGITKVCKQLGINQRWIQSAYGWLLAHGIGN